MVQTKKEEEVKEDNFYRCERSYGAFSRRVELPVKVQQEKVNATFKNGILEIRLPKAMEATSHVVNVKVA